MMSFWMTLASWLPVMPGQSDANALADQIHQGWSSTQMWPWLPWLAYF